LAGDWVNLSQFSDFEEFQEFINELHSDEDDPEFMYQDFECPELFKSMELISECHISENIFDVIEALEAAYLDIEVYSAYASHTGFSGDIEDLISAAEEAYQGEFESDEDFAQNMAEDLGLIQDRPAWPHYCIDWEYAARELMYDYFEESGYYFRSL
jgi:antirestriction protein